jgi:rhodanese-related sulfurtransferase
MINSIPVEDAKLVWESGECQVIDVREYSEYSREHIADTRLMPLSNFEKHADEIDHSKPVYLMCRSGNRAKQAAERLINKGFKDVFVIAGGITAWASAELPTIKGESKAWGIERQVRFTAGLFVTLGIILAVALNSYFILISAAVGIGLVFSAVTDTCGMAMVLAKMPWNKQAPKCLN